MKLINKSPPRLAALLAGAAFLGLVSQSALAAGTASNTTISNMASIRYDVGGTPLYVCSAPGAGNSTLDSDGTCVDGVNGAGITSFKVDNKVDVLVTEVNSTYTTSSAGSTAQTTTFTVKNEGNTTQDFSLAVANLVSTTSLFSKTDNFQASNCTVSLIAISTGTMGPYTAGDQHINALTADSVATATVSCDIPAAQADGDFAAISLTATARADNAANSLGAALSETANTVGGVEIVFGDDAGTDDAAGDGAHSARDGYLVTAPRLTIAKTVTTLCDPVDGDASPHNIPGAVVRWTITIANAATASSATLTSISDAIPTNTTFDPDMITGTGSTAANGQCEYAAAGSGTPASGSNANGVRIQNSVARPMVGSAAGTVTSSYFTGAADADGVTVGANVDVTFATALPAGGGYAAGELKPGETLTVTFNVGIN